MSALPVTVRAPDLDRIRLYARFRRDLYRRWLFFEVEPEIAWPWNPVRGRYSAWGGTIRVEVQVRGKDSEVHPPAPDPARPPTPTEQAPTEAGSAPALAPAPPGRGSFFLHSLGSPSGAGGVPVATVRPPWQVYPGRARAPRVPKEVPS